MKERYSELICMLLVMQVAMGYQQQIQGPVKDSWQQKNDLQKKTRRLHDLS